MLQPVLVADQPGDNGLTEGAGDDPGEDVLDKQGLGQCS